MQKKATIVTIILILLVFIGTMVGVYLFTSANSKKELSAVQSEIDSAQGEIKTLEEAKDTNGFTATEVVKTFFNEVKSDSLDKAKLYLAPEVQDMDIKATLKLGSDLSNVITGDNLEEANGENMDVNMTFVLAEDDTTVRTFSLSKYDGAWKIVGVIAE